MLRGRGENIRFIEYGERAEEREDTSEYAWIRQNIYPNNHYLTRHLWLLGTNY